MTETISQTNPENDPTKSERNEMTATFDHKLSNEEIHPADHTAPIAFGKLIKTKEDAIAICRVIRGDVVISEIGTAQCDVIATCLQYWGTAEFASQHAPRIIAECDVLDEILTEHHDFGELMAVRVPLYALHYAVCRSTQGVTSD